MTTATRADRLEAALRRAFAPTRLFVSDDSARHAGHAGAAPGGQTHYAVLLVSPLFRGQARVARARAVHAALAQEFAEGMHALALTLRTPEEENESATNTTTP
ncbi:MAG: BolA/IbaG family iron-sulfur metabolism protein [Acidisphaera sp.]|nr:BolA/IbaG family iron-sulfur metabolism protein [Acidisphaera sp.]